MNTECPPDFELPEPFIIKDDICINGGIPKTIYDRRKEFGPADQHALRVNHKVFDDFRHLMWCLIYQKPFNSLQRVRIIVRWLSIPRLSGIKFRTVEENSLEELFTLCGSQEGEVSYPKLFQLLACYSELYCTEVPGYAKGAGYLPGDIFTNTEPNHMWNAVCLDGLWYLLDIQWATRFVTTTSDDELESMEYAFDEFFLFMNPYQALYSHFPSESKWQLLPAPVTLGQFEQLPEVHPQFFTSGMRFLTPHGGVLSAPEGKLHVSYAYTALCEFTFKLKMEIDGQRVGEIDGIDLGCYGILDVERSQVHLYLRLPQEGFYYVTLYSKVIKAMKDIDEIAFKALISYQVQSGPPTHDSVGINGHTDSAFGPSWALCHHLGVRPTNFINGIIPVRGPLNCTVSLMLEKDHPTINLVTKIRNPSCKPREDSQDPYNDELIVEEVETAKGYMVKVRLPKYGEYVVEIYVNSEQQGDMYTLLAQCILDFKDNQIDYICDIPLDDALAQSLSSIPDPYASQFLNEKNPYEKKYLEDYAQSMLVSSCGEHILAGRVYYTDMQTNRISPKAAPFQQMCCNATTTLIAHDPSSIVCKDMRSPGDTTVDIEKQFGDPRRSPGDTTLGSSSGVSSYEGTVETSKKEKQDYKDVNEVLDSIDCKNLETDEERVRAIYNWLCSVDLDHLTFAQVTPNSPEDILLSIKKGNMTYADAFASLCAEAKMESVTIKGIAKGVFFHLGEELSEEYRNRIKHSWNAVKVNGKWALCDCQWGARRLRGNKDDERELKYELDPFYCLVNPEHLKFTHHPDESQWQLVEQPFTLQQFLNTPVLKSSFFKHRLELHSHQEGIIENEGDLTISIKYPQELLNKLLFSLSLHKQETKSSVSTTQREIFRHGISYPGTMETPITHFSFRLPGTGEYPITILLCELGASCYESIIEYVVKVDNFTSSMSPREYPNNPLCTNYGPTEEAFKIGIECAQPPLISEVDGMKEINFISRQQTAPRMLCKMQSLKKDTKVMEDYIIYMNIPDYDAKRLINTYKLFFPEEGEYSAMFYCLTSSNSKEFVLVWQMLLTVVNNCGIRSPKYCKKLVLGGTPALMDLKVKTLSHEDPIIDALALIPEPTRLSLPWADSDMAIVLRVPEYDMNNQGYPVKIYSEMKRRDNKDEDCTNFVLQQSWGKKLMLQVRFPKAGYYILRIFGHPHREKPTQIPLLFTYALNAPVREENCVAAYVGQEDGPFPAQSNRWRDGCFLMSPLNGRLYRSPTPKAASERRLSLSTNRVPVSLKLRGALDVCVVIDNQYTRLQPEATDENDNVAIWNGSISLPAEENKKITLCGKWPCDVDGQKYPVLLEFIVKNRPT